MREDGTMSEGRQSDTAQVAIVSLLTKAAGNTSDASPAKAPVRSAPAPAPAAAAAATVSDTMEARERVPLKRLSDEAVRLLLGMEQVEDELPSKPTGKSFHRESGRLSVTLARGAPPDPYSHRPAAYATTTSLLNFRGFPIDGKHGFGSLEDLCVNLVGENLGRETGKPGKKRGRSPDPGPGMSP